jgi:micrococcal nuclease
MIRTMREICHFTFQNSANLFNRTAYTTAVLVLISTAALADPCEGPIPKPGKQFTGTVRYIGDGDSICVGKTNNPKEWIEVRIADFYAPELHERGGAKAKAILKILVFDRLLECTAQKRSYDRVIAICNLDGTSIGTLMRRSGVAEGGLGR